MDVIERLSTLMNVKGVRSFLGHANFYRRFIKYFSKIPKPLCSLLEKDTLFDFKKACLEAFEELKSQLISAPITVTPDWNSPFKLTCDASYYDGSKKE